MDIIDISKDNFDSEVIQSDKPVLLDFWAPWCGHCLKIAPLVEEIAEENPNIKVCKINIDGQPELAEKFGVMSIPSLFAIKNGQVVNQAVGARPKAKILEMFE